MIRNGSAWIPLLRPGNGSISFPDCAPKDEKRYGNLNCGHEYGAGRSPQLDGTVLPPLDWDQRRDLLEYLKTL